MLAEAIRISRKADVNEFNVSIGLVDGPFLAFNKRRTAFIVNSPPTNRVCLRPVAAALLDRGITLFPQSGFKVFSIDDWGKAIFAPWRCITVVAAQIITVYEIESDAG